MIHITKVVTRNIIMDMVSSFYNLIGKNLIAYEKMIDKGIKEIQDEIKTRELKFKWYRFETNQLTNGAVAILFYGEEK